MVSISFYSRGCYKSISKGAIITKRRLLVIGIAVLLVLVGISGCLEKKSVDSSNEDNWETPDGEEANINEDRNESGPDDSESNGYNDTGSDKDEEPEEDSPENHGYTLTIEIIGSGDVVKYPNQVTYVYNAIVDLTANPEFNWIFAGWSGDITGSDNPENIIMDSDKWVRVTFEKKPPEQHRVFGILYINEVSAPEGVEVKLDDFASDFTDDTGYYQLDFEDNEGVATFQVYLEEIWYTPIQVNIQSGVYEVEVDLYIYPPEEPQYTLTIEIVGSGYVVENPDQEIYAPGTVVDLTAVPDTNWIFRYWAGDITSSNNPETITIDSNKTVIAAFEEEPEPFIIQEAIDNAEDGDTIFVPSGTYYESLQINTKSVILIGEDKGTTIIEGSIHLIYADDTSISGFTIRRSAGHGITIKYSNHISVSDNIILNWGVGMGLYNSDNNIITGNVILNCDDGIYFSYSSSNIITLNTVGSSNWYGVNVRDLSDNNLFHHNNFINNPKGFRDYCSNTWDDENEGNYWDDYNGTDGDGDGIGDTPYFIIDGNEDRYPLMNEA